MNSERMLRECINSVYENVPVKNLIVVDGFSTDATADIIAGVPRKIRERYLRSRKRNKRQR